MRVFSHRGFHFGADVAENTTAAFERAIANGVDGIETDVRLSGDLQSILFHDRIAPDGRPVDSISRKELQELTGHEIPTLDEVLARWPEVTWNLEVKCTAAVPATIELVRSHSRPDMILITSFCHDIVAACACQLNVSCGILLAHRPTDLRPLLEPWHGLKRVRTVVFDFNVAARQIIDEGRHEGFDIWVYGPVTPNEHRQCQDWKVDGVITDYPPRARGN